MASISQTLFLKFDKDGTKFLDKNEIKSLLKEMHINFNPEIFEKTFWEFDKNHNNQLDYEEFKEMMTKISLKDEAKPIFQAFCEKGQQGVENVEMNVMTEIELRNFFIKEQNQKMDLQNDIRPLIDFYNDNSNKEKRIEEISFLNFCNILFSMSNEVFNKEKAKIFQVLYKF